MNSGATQMECGVGRFVDLNVEGAREVELRPVVLVKTDQVLANFRSYRFHHQTGSCHPVPVLTGSGDQQRVIESAAETKPEKLLAFSILKYVPNGIRLLAQGDRALDRCVTESSPIGCAVLDRVVSASKD